MVENRLYNSNVDLWCLGILTYEFCVGRPPFESDTQVSTCNKIKAVDLKFPTHLSNEVCDLISKLIQKDPSNRLDLDDVINHKWIRQFVV